MKFFVLPVPPPTASQGNTTSYFIHSICLLVVSSLSLLSSLYSQQLVINPGSSMVLNGNVSLVVNNAAFKNDGSFVAGNSTVDFSGHTDTMVSNISGANATTFNNLSVSKIAFGLALKSSVIVKNVLTLNDGHLYTDSNLTLRSDANLTARVAAVPATSQIIGKTNVERYIPARRAWRLMTAPVTNSGSIFETWQNKGVYTVAKGTLITGPNASGALGNGLDYSVQNTVSMKGWNAGTQAFTNVLNSKQPISSGTNGSADNSGYFIFVRGDRNPVNTNVANYNVTTLTSIGSLQTGTQTFSASPTINKYTLIGNPYASPVDFNQVALTNLVKRFYVWDPTLNQLGGYVMVDDLNNDGVFVKSVPGSSQTQHIQSSQAFFVQSTGGGASITFTENSKSGNTFNGMFRPPATNTTAGVGTGHIFTTLNLLESGNKTILADGAIAEFDNIYSAAIDLDDAVKFSNTNENISIVKNNSSLAAERRPSLTEKDTLYFRINNTSARSYQFVFETAGLNQAGLMGFLEDSYLGTSTVIDLSGTTKVNFSITAVAASAAVNRFKIVFKNVAVVLPVSISAVKAFEKNSNIQVEWKVENEINMLKYDVEESTDGISFAHAVTIDVAGNSNAYNTYSWLDVNPEQGNNYYRIKSYDRNGEVKFSSIVKVNMGKAPAGFSIYPNPVTGNVINIVTSNQPAGTYQVKLSNAMGQAVFVQRIQINNGNSTQSLNTGAKLRAGIYQMEITGNNHQINTQKLIVE